MTSRYAFLMLALVGVAVVLFRMFGVFFFAASNSMWLLVPALVIGALLLATAGAKPAPAWLIAGALGLYLWSYKIAGWDRIKLRLSEGADLVPDIPEIVLIALLLMRWWQQRGARLPLEQESNR